MIRTSVSARVRRAPQLRLFVDSIVTKDRFALVTVTISGELYIIIDIGMRMLWPRELFLCQGFPKSYVIDCSVLVRGRAPKKLTKSAQTRLCGNSVPPDMPRALVQANVPHLCRTPRSTTRRW